MHPLPQVFELPAGRERAEVSSEIQLSVRHATNRWKEMADIQLVLYALPGHITSTSFGGSFRTEVAAARTVEVRISIPRAVPPPRHRVWYSGLGHGAAHTNQAGAAL